MKPAIYYTVRGSLYGGTFETIAVTSEKVSRSGSTIIYGRDRHGNATHFSSRDIHGRFETFAEASLGVAAACTARDAFRGRIEAAEAALVRLRGEQRDAVKDALMEAAR